MALPAAPLSPGGISSTGSLTELEVAALRATGALLSDTDEIEAHYFTPGRSLPPPPSARDEMLSPAHALHAVLVPQLCEALKRAARSCTGEDEAQTLRDFALTVATLDRMLETPPGWRLDLGGMRSLQDMLRSQFALSLRCLRRMTDIAQSYKTLWALWCSMPVVVAAVAKTQYAGLAGQLTTVDGLTRLARLALSGRETSPGLSATLGRPAVIHTAMSARVLLASAAGSLYLWLRMCPRFARRGQHQRLVKLHARLLLLLRLWELCRGIYKTSQPASWMTTWEAQLLIHRVPSDGADKKTPAQDLLETIPMTHEAGFWYRKTVRLRALVFSFRLIFSTFGMTHSLRNWPVVRNAVAVPAAGVYNLLQPSAASACASEVMTHPDLALLRKILSLDKHLPMQIYRKLSAPQLAVELELEARFDKFLPPVRVVVLSKKPLPANVMDWLLRGGGRGGPEDAPALNAIFHVHGGGFIGESIESDKVYLYKWIEAAGCPCISVRYDLAPEQQFPHQPNQCFSAYRCLVDGFFGFRPKRIVLTGDSAGGNLAAVTAVKAIKNRIKIPAGMVLAYPVLNLSWTPSPSRAVFMGDPLVPVRMLDMCSNAYLPPSADPFDGECSPRFAPPNVLSLFPPTCIHVGEWDPFLDDAVDMYQTLAHLAVTASLHVVPQVPHGFMNMAELLPHARQSREIAQSQLADLVRGSMPNANER